MATLVLSPMTPNQGVQARRAALGFHGKRVSGSMLFRLQSNRPCRHDVLNDHLVILHHNPIYYEL